MQSVSLQSESERWSRKARRSGMSTLYEVIACQDDFHLKERLPLKAAVQVNEGRRDINSESSI